MIQKPNHLKWKKKVPYWKYCVFLSFFYRISCSCLFVCLFVYFTVCTLIRLSKCFENEEWRIVKLVFFLFWWVKERKRLTNWLYPCFFLEEVQKKYFKNKVKKKEREQEKIKNIKKEKNTHTITKGETKTEKRLRNFKTSAPIDDMQITIVLLRTKWGTQKERRRAWNKKEIAFDSFFFFSF